MATIRIEYDSKSQDAILSAGNSCDDYQWGYVRRFFEERYPNLVENEHRSLTIPWWAFLAIREPLRQVLSVNSIGNLDVDQETKALLGQAKARSDQYKQIPSLQFNQPDSILQKLKELGWDRILMPYQARNVARLCAIPSGATFSVPGAGKTTEALAFYYLTRDANDKLLVIAPKNAFVAWEDELPICVPNCDFSFVRLSGGQYRISQILEESPRAVIISYQQLYRVRNEVVKYLLCNPVYMFIDESHRMKKGQEGIQGSAILSMAHMPKRKLLLSGTPMPNSSTDLVPQFTFLYPELAVRSENAIDNFKSIFVRTTKSELGLIAPRRIIQNVDMAPAQDRLYQSLASDTARILQGLDARDRIRLRRIARSVQYMLEAASNPVLLAGSELAGHPLLEEAICEGISAKIECASALARKWVKDGHKVVIWSTFVNTVEFLASLLTDCGAQFIHGGVPTSEDDDAVDSRETKIRDFNNSNSSCRILVANPAACSEGISLHKTCHRAIYVDRNYNAAQYLQSEDRIHRIGILPGIETIIALLVSPKTIDESVNRRLESKVRSMQSILGDPDLNITPLNLDDDDDLQGLTLEDVDDLKSILKV